ncbi:MAG: S8 family serine peptidase [Jannaschia sp.]
MTITSKLLADPKASTSWFLSETLRSPLTINLGDVWEDYRGAGVKIGVLDSQIDFTHNDLSTNYDTRLDFNFDQNSANVVIDPRSMTDAHGTMVAGVIAAEGGNGIGGVGIAPEATLVGLGISYSSQDVVAQVVNGLRAGAAVDVVNSSWSFNQNFYDDFSDPDNAAMAEAVRLAAETGRDGLGTNLVFSAGNSRSEGSSNYHNFQNSPYAISVGAVDKAGDAWANTSIGANVLISGPGAAVTTTSLSNKYTTATGTSFAAPAVSAVVGLMLEANPDLGYRDVQQILALSASRDGLGAHPEDSEGWRVNGADNLNGGGMHYSDAFGFGFLNVHNAVRLAETWTAQQTAGNRDEISVTKSIDERLVAGENDEIKVQIEVDQTMQVEHVQIAVDFYYPHTGNLDVYLISPEGTSVQLVYERGQASNGNFSGFAFSSVGSMGEMSKGIWTLQVINRNPESARSDGTPLSGVFEDVTLTIYGDGDDFREDTYVYTDEFGILHSGADLAERRVLQDTDGGIDAINAAAVTSDSRIDLSGKGPSIIAGVDLDIRDPGKIENIFSGDGDDELTGNAADNWMAAGRGDDDLHFSAGNDTLDGGDGYDTLHIGGVFAAISGFFTDIGTLMMGFIDMGLSAITGIESFRFTDVTYSAGEVEGLFRDGKVPVVPETPDVESPVVIDVPVVEEEIAQTPTEGPVVEVPPAEEPRAEETPPEDPVVEDPVKEEPPVEEATPVSVPEDGLEYDEFYVGTSRADKLRGSEKNDHMSGGNANDILISRGGNDYLDGGAGDDRVKSGGGHDILKGGDGDDQLFGDAGNDFLEGGTGRDILTGGTGADTFIFSLTDADQIDIIRDFSKSEGDRIVLTGLAGASAEDFRIIERADVSFIHLTTGDGNVRLVKVLGDSLELLTINQSSAGEVVFG